jgi:hypothetical protein
LTRPEIRKEAVASTKRLNTHFIYILKIAPIQLGSRLALEKITYP